MDTLIAGATLYDGFGGSGRPADVRISGGVISGVGEAGTLDRTGAEVVDGAGLALAPGFLDAHSHSDENYFDIPGADSKLSQGITTEICGNCGFSPDEKDDHGGLAGFIRHLEDARPAVNVATFTGFNSLRMQVLGTQPRPATEREVAEMKTIFAAELNLGSLGLSSGLYYTSAKFAPTAEVAALAALLNGTGKPYATHLRSEDAGLLEAIREAIGIASAGSGSLQISHFKTKEEENFAKLPEALRLVEQARADGLRVHGDRYPYTCSSTGLRTIAPPPFDALADGELRDLLARSPEKRAELAAAWREGRTNWTKILVVDSANPAHAPFLGKTVAEIADLLRMPPEEACAQMLSEAMPRAAFDCMSEANLHTILRQDWIFAGSDAGCRAFDDGKVHPRAFGTMPRFFRLARTQGIATGEIIRRMTLAPAVKFQLPRRGAVKPGLAADLVLFDEERFDSAADYVQANRTAVGIRAVWVNGRLAYTPEDGVAADRSGRFLRGGKD